MKLILQYDPWGEQREATRACVALNTLGIPVEMVSSVPKHRPEPEPDMTPVKFDSNISAPRKSMIPPPPAPTQPAGEEFPKL